MGNKKLYGILCVGTILTAPSGAPKIDVMKRTVGDAGPYKAVATPYKTENHPKRMVWF